ncbi:MAG: biotin--[acetyl-CoA-carboxylase] ligase, partial [Rhodospirillales bacterium]
VFDALGSVGKPGHEVAFKWPNDILLNGSKVGGLLLEAETAGGVPDWVILGVGVNVTVFPGDADFPATSLRAEGWGATEVAVLEAFGRHFVSWTGKWLDKGFEPIRKTWLWRAHGKGEEIEIRLGEETVTGVFADLDEHGALVVETADGERRIAAGDVFFRED